MTSISELNGNYFNYYLTSNLCFNQFSGTLEGLEANGKVNDQKVSPHLYITCDMFSNGKLLCPTQQTPYKQMINRYESVFTFFYLFMF